MAEYTLTFSEGAQGWTSFFSYHPEAMVGMNNYFYTFKDGNLYRHNTNDTRNNFYGTQYNSKIIGFLNDNPEVVKKFKTIYLDSTAAWDTTITTDLGSGFINADWFVEKEGNFYAHIRRTANDNVLELRSAQGIGDVTTVNSTTPSETVLTFGFTFDTIISVGDNVYKESSGSISLVGSVESVDRTAKTITVDTTVAGGSVPSNGQFLLYIKDNIAESYGAEGYYLKYEIENDSTSFVEIFSIGSNLFKSFP